MVRLAGLAVVALFVLGGQAFAAETSESRFYLEPSTVTQDKDGNPITVGSEVHVTVWIDLKVTQDDPSTPGHVDPHSVTSFGLSICHDPEELEPGGTLVNEFWEEGQLWDIIRAGKPSAFIFNSVAVRASPTEGFGITQGIVFDLAAKPFAFTADELFSNIILAYRPLKGNICSELLFDGFDLDDDCKPLGGVGAEIDTSILITRDDDQGKPVIASITPGTQDGAKISVDGAACDGVGEDVYKFLFSQSSYNLSADPPETVKVKIAHTPEPISGFTFGVENTAGVTPTGANPIGVLAPYIDDPVNKDHEFQVVILPSGITVSAVTELSAAPPTLPAADEAGAQEVVEILYACEQQGDVTLTFTDQLGTPKVPLTMDALGTMITPEVGPSATATCAEIVTQDTEFARCDVNQDGIVTLSDAVVIAMASFGTGLGTMGCDDAADADDNEKIEVADAVLLLRYLYGGSGIPPAEPFDIDSATACDKGNEGADDPLKCTTFDLCGG